MVWLLFCTGTAGQVLKYAQRSSVVPESAQLETGQFDTAHNRLPWYTLLSPFPRRPSPEFSAIFSWGRSWLRDDDKPII